MAQRKFSNPISLALLACIYNKNCSAKFSFLHVKYVCQYSRKETSAVIFDICAINISKFYIKDNSQHPNIYFFVWNKSANLWKFISSSPELWNLIAYYFPTLVWLNKPTKLIVVNSQVPHSRKTFDICTHSIVQALFENFPREWLWKK